MSLLAAFLADGTGRRYRRVLEDERVNFAEVLGVLEEPDHQRAMEWAERRWGRPALAGVVAEVEALPSVRRFLSAFDVRETARFRQAVGVAVRIVMESRGWSTTGDKGAVSGARWFRKAERYRPPASEPQEPPTPADSVARLTASRRAMQAIGTDEERRQTLDLLVEGLAATRSAEGRTF